LAESQDTLTDDNFGVSAAAIKLNRVVEMYQWDEESSSETKKKVGGGTETKTTYKYQKIWSERAIDSSEFKKPTDHTNPGSFPYESIEKVAQNVKFGGFKLSSSLINRISNTEPITLKSLDEVTVSDENAKISNGKIYIGDDSAQPRVGDLRISFKKVPNTEVSVVARQVRDTFEAYKTKAGGDIELLSVGTLSAERMFQDAEQANVMLTWGLRIFGFILMYLGLSMILKPLSVFADVLPLLGDLVGVGTGLIALLIALACSTVTVGIAWLFYRPLLSIVLFLVTGGSLFLIIKKVRGQKQGEPAAAVAE